MVYLENLSILQILFTIDRLQAVSDTLTNVAGGSHGDRDVGLLHRDHSQADISPLNDTLSPSPHDRKSGDMRLEDIAGPSFSKRKSPIFDPGICIICTCTLLRYG